jgi:acyl carrier protein
VRTTIEKALQQFVVAELLMGSDATVGDDEPIVASGRVDSLGLLKLIAFVDERYGVDLMTVGEPDDFVSIATMAACIRSHQGP